MKTIEKCMKTELEEIISPYYDVNKVMFFDIETTGFVARQSDLYLIGCCYFKDGCLNTVQWFNDDGESEYEVIVGFSDFISKYSYILSFNGEGFDIPYIQAKLKTYKLEDCFINHESIDLYKLLRGMKDALHLDNMKQKTIEAFLGLKRDDRYNGGELIKVYKDYIKTNDEELEKLLLLHNFEDVCGMPELFTMLSYVSFKQGNFIVDSLSVNNGKLELNIVLDASIPRRLNVSLNQIQLSGYHKDAVLRVPIVNEELKFFYKNYKEYYYLPLEDTAIHKSVASYVDKNYRTQATKENCYIKKDGFYISQLRSNIMSGYKKNASDKETFIPLHDSFLQDNDLLNQYAKCIVSELL